MCYSSWISKYHWESICGMQKYCLWSPSLSLSLSHTHTHTHTCIGKATNVGFQPNIPLFFCLIVRKEKNRKGQIFTLDWAPRWAIFERTKKTRIRKANLCLSECQMSDKGKQGKKYNNGYSWSYWSFFPKWTSAKERRIFKKSCIVGKFRHHVKTFCFDCL